ncbi:hypothetical protein N7478_004687 [Penicillium angulare]|uniref:uncharacterized protein n=1 Tax=Penicillium angulare TaxID=116970 RepID=UPI00254091DA|nr:uncharacterized protein N7478_004687 [Penicillium angulare]KAJ5279315.1 hypothetical protein N7478_004687 [Penicillium angulare]
MEPAQEQLGRALAPLSRNLGTSHPSVSADRVALTYLVPWDSFAQDAFETFRLADISHNVPVNDESELYTVGNELGLSGRFVRNLCDPVMKALKPLPGMQSMRFADFQALSRSNDTVPDVCFGLISIDPSVDNVCLAGELKTPWTVEDTSLHLNTPRSYHLEYLIGRVVAQMRTSSLRFAFLSTYNSTVFVERTADLCFRLSAPIRRDSLQPSLRQLFAGFCLMAFSGSKYRESPSFNPRVLRGPPPIRSSSRGERTPDYPTSSSANQLPSITPKSVIISSADDSLTVVNCTRQLSDPRITSKGVWLGELNGNSVILKCWNVENVELFETEAGVYERIWDSTPHGIHLFSRWLARGAIICSSVFPFGFALITEPKDGSRLDEIWHTLSETERIFIQSECLIAINALRQVSVRLDDAGQHNILYSRDTRTVTLLDFEVAQNVEANTVIPVHYEMERIFRRNFRLGRPIGG